MGLCNIQHLNEISYQKVKIIKLNWVLMIICRGTNETDGRTDGRTIIYSTFWDKLSLQRSSNIVTQNISRLICVRKNLWNTCCAWAWGTFFPVVLLCQFLVLAGNRFWFYLLCTYVLREQYSCGVVLVFRFWQEKVFGVTYVLSVQYSCAVVSVLWLWREIVL